MADEQPLDELLAWLDRQPDPGDRPSVTLAYAQSLDGSIALRKGEPVGLSGPQSLTMTHHLRAAHDAILVGIGTVLADNPRLTVRHASGKSPKPVVLDSQLRLPEGCRLRRAALPPWVLTSEDADPARAQRLLQEGGAVLPIPAAPKGGLDLSAAGRALRRGGIRCLMVEGGARVIESFLRERLVDQVVLTIAPCYLGGLQPAPHLPKGKPVPIAAPRWRQFGQDLVLWGRPAWTEA
jgi:3,4-dihydroxy 2-butanone 4-phosphate synthase/GTP cyclohydrolase II